MAEGQGNECPEEKFCEAVETGMEEVQYINYDTILTISTYIYIRPKN